MPKRHETDSDVMHARIRELTQECRRLRQELTDAMKRRGDKAMVEEIPRAQRRNRPKPKKSDH